MTTGLDLLDQAVHGTLKQPQQMNSVERSGYPPIMDKAAIENTSFKGQ